MFTTYSVRKYIKARKALERRGSDVRLMKAGVFGTQVDADVKYEPGFDLCTV